MGKVYFWLFPNLNEDLGVIESFKPLYSLKKHKTKKSKKTKQSTESDNNSKAETKADTTDDNAKAEAKPDTTDDITAGTTDIADDGVAETRTAIIADNQVINNDNT